MAKFDLRTYAKVGAAARVAELRTELTEIYRMFPELRRAGGADGAGIRMSPHLGRAGGADGAGIETPKRKRKRRNLTAVQRAEISKRMKKRWAAAKRAGQSRLG